MDRRGVLDRGCLRNHRLRQNVVDLAQTQVSGPSDMGSDGDSRPISFWSEPLLKAAYPDPHPFQSDSAVQSPVFEIVIVGLAGPTLPSAEV